MHAMRNKKKGGGGRRIRIISWGQLVPLQLAIAPAGKANFLKFISALYFRSSFSLSLSLSLSSLCCCISSWSAEEKEKEEGYSRITHLARYVFLLLSAPSGT